MIIRRNETSLGALQTGPGCTEHSQQVPGSSRGKEHTLCTPVEGIRGDKAYRHSARREKTKGKWWHLALQLA